MFYTIVVTELTGESAGRKMYYHDTDSEIGNRLTQSRNDAYAFYSQENANSKFREIAKEFAGDDYMVELLAHDDTKFSNYMNQPIEETDPVNHPSHYESGKFECIEVMEEALGYDAVRDFCICNAFKYLYRHKRKNGYEDIKKAQWYINKYIEMTEEAKENGLEPM